MHSVTSPRSWLWNTVCLYPGRWETNTSPRASREEEEQAPQVAVHAILQNEALGRLLTSGETCVAVALADASHGLSACAYLSPGLRSPPTAFAGAVANTPTRSSAPGELLKGRGQQQLAGRLLFYRGQGCSEGHSVVEPRIRHLAQRLLRSRGPLRRRQRPLPPLLPTAARRWFPQGYCALLVMSHPGGEGETGALIRNFFAGSGSGQFCNCPNLICQTTFLNRANPPLSPIFPPSDHSSSQFRQNAEKRRD
jgi:hypothetical protein